MKKPNYKLASTLVVLALTALRSLAQSPYEPYTFGTLAGTNGYHGSADGTGSAARFFQPTLLAADSAGNVYVPDLGNHTIRKVTPAGAVTTLAGNASITDQYGDVVGGSADGTGRAARFNSPSGVAVDGSGNLYVTDTSNSTIRKVTPAGVVTTLAGRAENRGSADGTGRDARFYGPIGIAVDSSGNLYVADTGNHTIRKVTPAGVVTTLAGRAGNEGSADGTGRNARFNEPIGVAVDSTGNLYVADADNYTIRKVTSAGVVTTLVELAGSSCGADGTASVEPLARPWGVAVDSGGNLYITYLDNSTIRKMTPTGVAATVAGLFENLGSADGTGRAARFNGPWGVAVDSTGNVYVADTGNNTIRKGYPAPRILTCEPGFGITRGQFSFNLTGPAGRSAIVEASTDLVSWLPIWTNTFTFPAELNFSDPQSGVHPNRFYRTHVP